MHNRCLSYLLFSICLIFSVCSVSNSIGAPSKYTQTIAVLTAVYNNEIQAAHDYAAFAEKARAENFPKIANLFSALSESEKIHARNFKSVLFRLEASAPEASPSDAPIGTTKQNLKYAVTEEISEIGTGYPEALERVRGEGCQEAIDYLTYAWKAEHQHRDLFQQIKKNSGLLFPLVAAEIKEKYPDYFVCQHCGSSLMKLPEANCPICAAPVSEYKAIQE